MFYKLNGLHTVFYCHVMLWSFSLLGAVNILTMMVILMLWFQLLQDASSFVDHLGNWELVLWCLTLCIFLMRFVTLGTSINKKYRNFSVLITEQVTVCLQQRTSTLMECRFLSEFE